MSEWGNQAPAPLLNFRDWVPDKCRFWLYILFLIAFQFSNGFYFTTMAQLVGARSLVMNDVHMYGQTVLIGLTFFFPLAFRLKFRFTNRTSLTIAALALAVINIVFPYVSSYPVTLLLCYAGGFFRLYGTFECFSNLLPKITPSYNYGVFLSFVFFVVLGCIHVFDWVAIQIIYQYDWQHVHLLAVALCLCVAVLVRVTMRAYRPKPKMPLYGIDVLGMILWSVFILSAIYVVQYGNQLDWWASDRLRIGMGICFISLSICLLRMVHIRHPFIEPKAFGCPNLFYLLLLFLCLDVLLGAQNVLQNTFTGSVLGYDQLATSQLKWPEFAGGAAGAAFCWMARTRWKWRLKTLTFLSMGAVALYAALMTRLVSAQLPMGQLWLPVFIMGFGHVGVFIALTIYAQAYCDFKYYFQVICLLGFIRTGLGETLGMALWERALTGGLQPHLAQTGQVFHQALITTLQEMYGYATVFGVVVLLAILCSFFDRHFVKTI